MGLQGHKKLIIPERVSRPNGCGCRRCSETYGDLRQRSGTSKFIHHFYHFARFFRGRCYRKWRVSKGKSGFANYQKKIEPIADFSRCARRCSLAKRILIVKTSFGTSGLNIYEISAKFANNFEQFSSNFALILIKFSRNFANYARKSRDFLKSTKCLTILA